MNRWQYVIFAVVVLFGVPVFLTLLPWLLVKLFPGLHPCRRGKHVADFRHRIRVTAFGRGLRSRVGFVEQANYCPRCDTYYSVWRVVEGPSEILETDLTDAENSRLASGGEVLLIPEAGKLWE